MSLGFVGKAKPQHWSLYWKANWKEKFWTDRDSCERDWEQKMTLIRAEMYENMSS